MPAIGRDASLVEGLHEPTAEAAAKAVASRAYGGGTPDSKADRLARLTPTISLGNQAKRDHMPLRLPYVGPTSSQWTAPMQNADASIRFREAPPTRSAG